MKLNNKGFTLVEVLAVVIILGLIGTISIASVMNSINSGKDTSQKLMISNIVVACEILYDEVSFDNNVYEYTPIDGATSNKVSLDAANKKIETNIQTLVSNGFLSGSNNCNEEGNCVFPNNKNKRIIIDPKTKEDLGECRITITKQDNGKYLVEKASDNAICPTAYVKEVK